MSSGFREFIEQVRSCSDLVQIIGTDVELRPSGSTLKGRSPFHPEKTPSFVVWPATQTWHDFSNGGGLGGDVFAYVQERDKLGFKEAVFQLAERAGLRLPHRDDESWKRELAITAERREVERLLTLAASYYHRVLPTEIRSEAFQQHYGFTDETIDQLQLGWADGHLFDHLTTSAGVSRQLALKTGLFIPLAGGRGTDFFRHRLVFPYWRSGRVVYFTARRARYAGDEPHEEPKYKKLLTHSERHDYVSPTVGNDFFYNEDAARSATELVITEGIPDCISAMQVGVPCISPGTTRFRNRDLPRLLELTRHVNRVILCNDAEASGAGEAGAIATAAALWAQGREVCIAAIPRPEGVDKIDVNELVATRGPEALRAVVAQANPYPEFLLERIPADAPRGDLQRRLDPVLASLTGRSAMRADAVLDAITAKFGVRRRALTERRKQLADAASKSTRADQPRNADALFEGEIREGANFYYTTTANDEMIAISSFAIHPTMRVVTEDGELIIGEARTDQGTTVAPLRLPLSAFHSKRDLIRQLPSADLQWTGSDNNVQGLLRVLARRPVPRRPGSKMLGEYQSGDLRVWLGPDATIGPDGFLEPSPVAYVPSGASLDARVRYVPADDETFRAIARVVFRCLPAVNRPEVILPVLGWFFATPMKPRFMKAVGSFPALFVWGTQGSGKSSLCSDVMWPLFGVRDAEPYSATETEFALLKLLSSTRSVPIFIDEYKPYDMRRHRLHTLHRYLRRLYRGETEERGRPDLTVTSYHLQAPVCIAGETRPTEAALLERILTANPDKTTLGDPTYRAAHRALRAVDLALFAPRYIQFCFGRDFEADLAVARTATQALVADRRPPVRVAENLTAMMLGIHLFREFARTCGCELPDDLDARPAIAAVLDDVLETDHGVKNALDHFLEMLGVMAVQGHLQHRVHYVIDDDRLALHLEASYDAFRAHCRRIDYDGEVVDLKALRRLIVENQKQDGFVQAHNERICFDGRRNRRRAVVIDLSKTDVVCADDFPRPESDLGPLRRDVPPRFDWDDPS